MSSTPQQFVQRSNLRGFLAIGRDWAAIAAVITVALWLDRWYLYPVAAWLIGAFQFALSEALLHEASHYNLFRKRSWNDRLEFLYGLPFFCTVAQMRAEHLVHHRRLGMPEDQLVADYRALGLDRPGVNMFWIWFVRPVLGFAGAYYCGVLSLRPWKEGRKIVAFWAVVLLICAALGVLHLLVLYWLIPFFWSCQSYLYWSEITDHYRTRTGIRSNLSPITNFLHHNNGFHYTHHHYPTIPWYLLPKATEALFPGQGDICHGFLDTYRSLSLSSGSLPLTAGEGD
ncbi:fatty acid desaturase [Cystobacter fuscus]|uniref:Fatty acid desaturase n=1 Tax=Cystobacter fuscus TaxID=43 RepID=A0A250JBF0_9BACT|nr:fatty acid desaturase [Cystobacter fuscus]ATB40900.1 fatty acid desaturase [Cystobacter fuscus]